METHQFQLLAFLFIAYLVMKDVKDHSLFGHNTFGIDAKCRRYVEYASVDDAQALCRSLTAEDQPLLIIGSGSNLLLTGDYPATVISPETRFEAIPQVQSSSSDHVELRCWAGTVFDDVVAFAVSNGWFGMENLSLIPGEVGASAVQNIGAYGAEVKDFITKVEAVEIATGNIVEFSNGDCAYSYRQSRFKNEWRDKYLITWVTYRLQKTFTPNIDYGNIKAKLQTEGIQQPTASQLRNAIIDIRNEKLPDPKVEGNAGSFFMNPIVDRNTFDALLKDYPGMPHYHIDDSHEKIPAGWMIEMCGWKGRTVGRVGVHSKQALVLVNRGGATGAEVVALYKAIQHDVKERFGVDIHPEVNVR